MRCVVRRDFVDIHCHILPGLDDGSRTWEMTEKMLHMELDQGVCGMIVTPHFWKGRWTAPPEKVRELASQLEERGRKIRPDFFVSVGNEIKYYGPTSVELVKDGSCLTMGDTKYVLLEFSYECSLSDIETAVNQVRTKGYRPILAHVERYKCHLKEYDELDHLIRRGAYLQVNAESLNDGGLGSRLFGEGAFIKKLLQYQMIHLVGTDTHNDGNRAPNMEKAAIWLQKKIGEAETRKLLYDNPLSLLKNEYL